jgi:hypothetical protein
LPDRPSPAQLMRRDPTASYSLRARQIATNKRFELTPLGLAGSCECSVSLGPFQDVDRPVGRLAPFPDSTVVHSAFGAACAAGRAPIPGSRTLPMTLVTDGSLDPATWDCGSIGISVIPIRCVQHDLLSE